MSTRNIDTSEMVWISILNMVRRLNKSTYELFRNRGIDFDRNVFKRKFGYYAIRVDRT